MTKDQEREARSAHFNAYFNAHGSGAASKLAEKMGISPSWLSQMSSGVAAISAVRAVEFETATNGEINRKGMFPATWPKIWPELADVA